MRLEFQSGERKLTVEVSAGGDGPAVTVDGVPADLELIGWRGGELDLRLDGRRRQAYVAADRDLRHLFLEGRVWTLRLPEDEDDVPAGALGGPEIVAQMPGKVVKVLVAEGQEVEEGRPLLIVESMKMESEILAPLAGSVEAVRVREGQTVGLGDVLLLVKPPDGPT